MNFKILSAQKRGIFVLLIGSTSYLLAMFQILSPPVIALEVKNDLGLAPDSLGMMFASTMLFYGLVQPFAGFCADRFGPKRCLLGSAVTMALGLILFSQAQGFALGIFSRMIIGLAAGVVFIPCMKLAESWFNPQHLGIISSAIVSFSALAWVLTGSPLAWATEAFGWRLSLMGVGIFSFLWAVALFFLVEDSPQKREVKTKENAPNFFTAIKESVKMPIFWILGFLYLGIDLIYCVFNSLWIGPYFMEAYGQTETAVGSMITLAAVSYFLGPTLLAIWGSVWGYFKVVLVVAVVNAILGTFLALSPEIPGVWVLYVLSFFSSVGGQITAVIMFMGQKLVPPNIGGTAMGILNLFPLVGAAAMQQIIGSLLTVDEKSTALPRELYSTAFMPMYICILITVFLTYYMMKNFHKFEYKE